MRELGNLRGAQSKLLGEFLFAGHVAHSRNGDKHTAARLCNSEKVMIWSAVWNKGRSGNGDELCI
jgi:hypothetical protein